MPEPQDNSTLKWIFRQLMGEGISNAIAQDAPVEPARPATIGPVKNRFSFEDPTAIPREWIHKKTEDYLGTPQSWLPSDLLSLISQPAGPEGANPAVSLGLIPRDFARRFASEYGGQIKDFPAWKALMPRTTDIVSTMFYRYPEIAGQLSDVGLVLPPPGQTLGQATNIGDQAIARYSRIPYEAGKRGEFNEMITKLMRRDPTTYKPQVNQWITQHGSTFTDEQLARMAQSFMGKFQFSPMLELASPVEAFTSVRHEFQHLLEDLRGQLPEKLRPMDQTYWIWPHEVRARAAGNNYGRDMAAAAGGRPFPARHQGTIINPRGKPVSYPEWISSELDSGIKQVEHFPTRLPMPADFEDVFREAVESLFTGPNARYKQPPKSRAFPAYWETYFKP